MDIMDMLKSTFAITVLYVAVAVFAVILGVWREHIYREKGDKQQEQLTAKQSKIGEQQQEIIRLIYKITEFQMKDSLTLNKDIAQVKLSIEEMRKQAIISDSTANEVIKLVDVKADGTYRADGSINASGKTMIKRSSPPVKE